MCFAESCGVLSLMAVDVRGSSAGWLVVCGRFDEAALKGGSSWLATWAGRRQIVASVVPVDDMSAGFDLNGGGSAPRLSRPRR